MLKKWKLLDKKNVLSNQWMTVEKRKYRLPNGVVSDSYYHFIRPDYVLIIATDDQKNFVLEKQYRRGVDEFIYDLPAGWIDRGESPVDAAKRELFEETGYKGSAEVIGKIYVQPGYSSQIAYVVLVNINLSEKSKNKFEQDENIESKFFSISEVNKMIKDGDLRDMGALSALELFEKHIE